MSSSVWPRILNGGGVTRGLSRNAAGYGVQVAMVGSMPLSASIRGFEYSAKLLMMSRVTPVVRMMFSATTAIKPTR